MGKKLRVGESPSLKGIDTITRYGDIKGTFHGLWANSHNGVEMKGFGLLTGVAT